LNAFILLDAESSGAAIGFNEPIMTIIGTRDGHDSTNDRHEVSPGKCGIQGVSLISRQGGWIFNSGKFLTALIQDGDPMRGIREREKPQWTHVCVLEDRNEVDHAAFTSTMA